MNPTKEFRDYLISQGAALVGLAPTREYYELYNSLSDKLDTIVTAGAKYLTDKGYHAYARTTDQKMADSDNCIPLSHQTLATRAGLGWIGKNNRLVTPQYGSAVRLSSLLTDAPLTCDPPVTHSQCGACHACVRYCPAHALKNTLWRPGIPRENIIAISTCHKKCREIMKKSTGIDADLCGKCFAVCTYTRQYLKQCRDV